VAGALGRRPRRVPDAFPLAIIGALLSLGMGVFALGGPVPALRWMALLAPLGLVSIWTSLRVRRLAAANQIDAAREASARALDVGWYVIGAALICHVVGFVLTFLLVRQAPTDNTPNPTTVFETYFPWEVWSDGEVWRSLGKGFLTNVSLALLAQFFILLWSLLIAVLRMLPGRGTAPIRFLVIAYGDLFRSLPGILVVLMVNFGLQKAQLPLLKSFSSYQYACLSLTLIYGAYVSEVFRAGLESVHPSQTSGARSLGLSYSQTLIHVSIPQAVRRVIPPLLNDFIALQKDTAILAFVGVFEVVARARFYNNNRATLAAYAVAAVFFFVFTIPQTRFADWLLKRQQNKQFGRTKGKIKAKDLPIMATASPSGKG
jgi:polar amino acid transport system permease protein